MSSAFVTAVVGTIAGIYGTLGLLPVVVLALTINYRSWPMTGYLAGTAALFLATALVCGWACIRRLDGDPACRWIIPGFILTVATLQLAYVMHPHYRFFGI